MAVLTTKQKRNLNKLLYAGRDGQLGDRLQLMDTDGSYTGSITASDDLSGTTNVSFEVETNAAIPSLALSAYAGGTGDHTITLMAPATLGQATTLTVPDAGGAADSLVLLALAQTLANKTLTAPTIAAAQWTNANHTHASAATGGNTLTIPAIGDFTNATHDHSNNAGGGALSLSSALVGTNATTFEVDLDGSIPAVALGVGTTGNFTQTIKPAATLTVGDVDLTLPDTANVDDSFVFVTLAQTLASKTLTDPTINACTITGAVTITTPSVTGTWTDLGTVDTVIIGGGTIDTTPIGGSTPAAGAFTTLAASGATTLSDDVAIAASKDLVFTKGTGYLSMLGNTDGELRIIPLDSGTSRTTLTTSDCVGNVTVTLPDATCTLLGTAAANTFTAVQTITVNDASNTAVTEVLALKHSTSGTAGTNIGTQLAFYVEDSADNLSEVADIEAQFTTATSGSEECDLIFKTAFDTGTVATALTIDASANELVLGEDTSLLTAMRIYPATTSYGSFVIKAGDDTGNNVTTLTTGVSAGTATLTLPVVTGTLSALNGTNTWSGVNTFTAEPVISMEDANATAVLDLLTLNRSVTGATAGGNDLGIGLTFEMEDDTGEEEKARLNIQQTTAARTTSDVDFIFSQNINGLVTETVRFDADAGVVVGLAAGSSLTSLRLYSSTASNGSILLAAADNTGNDTVTITNGTTTGDITITLPTVTSTLAVLGANSFTGAQTFTAGILASGSVANDFSAGTGTFLTSTGAVTIGPGDVGISGDVTLATTKSITATAGNGAFDFSVATGSFDTSTGTNTLNGDVTIVANKDFTQAGNGTFTTASGTNSLLGDVVVKGSIDTASATAMTIAPVVATSLVVGAVDVTSKIQASVLTLDSASDLTIQINATDALQIDDEAISGFAAAGEAAGHAVYTETEDGGTAATTGSAGGLFNLKTGDGSAGLLTAAGGAGGALAFATGDGGASVTGAPGASGAVTVATGTGGATTSSGTAAVSGDMTLSTGDGGASASGANAGGAAGTIALNGGTGGADSDTSDSGGVGGPIALTAGTGGAGATGGVGGGMTIDAGAAGAGGSPNDGSIDIGTNNSYVTTVTGESLVLDSTGVGVLQAGGVDLLGWDDTAIAIAAAPATTAGQPCYLGTEAGAVASASAGAAGGLLNITTGAGSAAATTQTGGAGGALALATGIGGNSTTGGAGASGAITIATGTAGATTTSGVGPVSGDVTISTGTGGISKSAADGGAAGTISLLGGTGGLDDGDADIGGAGGGITLTAGTGGNSVNEAGAGGAVTIDAGAAGTGGAADDGSIDIGTNNSLVTTVSGASLVLNSTGVGVLQADGTDLFAWDDTTIAFAAAGETAGQPCYLGTEAGGVATTTGSAGGLLNITTGAGSDADTTQTAGASGALALATGTGGDSTTGTPGVSGAITLTTGVAGATSTTGVGVDSGDITIATGIGGASEAGANAGGNAGTIALTGGVGGEDVTDANVGGIGGAITLTGGVGGAGLLGGAGGAVTINGGAAGNGGVPATGAISIGATNTASIGIGAAGNITTVTGALNLTIGDVLTFLGTTQNAIIAGADQANQANTYTFGDADASKYVAYTSNAAGTTVAKWTFGIPGVSGVASDFAKGCIAGCDLTLDLTQTEAAAAMAVADDASVQRLLSDTMAGAGYAADYQIFPDTELENDACYFGAAVPFAELYFDVGTPAVYGADSVIWEFYNGSSWATLMTGHGIVDYTDTNDQDGDRSFQRDGALSFVPPVDWDVETINTQEAYWIRARVVAGFNITTIPILNTVEHKVCSPTTSGFKAPTAGNISTVRIVNGNTTTHSGADIKFFLMNFTKGTYSIELTLAQSTRQTAYTTTALKAGSLGVDCDAGDVLGLVGTQEDGTNELTNVIVELDVTVTQ